MGIDPALGESRRDPIRATVRRGLARTAVVAASWTAIGLVFALPGVTTGPDWRRSLLASLAQWWSWGLVAPAIVAADRFLPSSDKELARRIVVHLLLSVPVTALFVYVFAAMLAAVGLEPWRIVADPKTLLGALRGMFLWNWLVYWLIAGAWQVYRYYERYLSS